MLDLLHAVPLVRIDAEHTKLAIALAFASGVSGGLFADALDRARVAPSSWEPASYANDLFLSQFVVRCFKVRIGREEPSLATNHLTKVLAYPPDDRETIEHRRAILAELVAVPELQGSLENLYLAICRFRTLLEGATGGRVWDANRRQLEILAAAKEIIDLMGKFAFARSGLSRLAAFSQRVRASEPYRSLSDLLEYDEKLATLDLKVRVGADGRIRGFDIISVQSNASNPFESSAWRRWAAKIELFARGYRFGDAEVMARLIDAVFDGIHDELVHFVQLLGDIEVFLGALAFRDLAQSAGLGVCLPTIAEKPEAPRTLKGLFNPLLLAHGVKPVPCDLETDRHDTTILVTGPNSGGKTRLLQSVGLAQLLAQSGLFVPARTATIALSRGLVVSLLQETRSDQAEGRLGMELIRIRELFERLPKGAMVLLDELCSGTNPSEGEEIFELVLRMLTRLDPFALITTHFLAFASRLEHAKRISELRFLQVALGPDEEPTYQFANGVAKTSLAGQAAKRLGVTGDQLMSLIEQKLAEAR